jgi:geranylgeranyl pyrophosphate synthase
VIESRALGKAIGMAFQIVDDLLDYTGKQATVGSRWAATCSGDHHAAGYLLPGNRTRMTRCSSSCRKTAVENGDVDRLVQSIRLSGAIEMAARDAQSYVSQGLEYLAKLPQGSQSTALEELSRYIVNRSR